MRLRLYQIALSILLLTSCTTASALSSQAGQTDDSATPSANAEGETAAANQDMPGRYERLTEDDYKAVAKELGVEVAAIKAVVEIEAGKTHEGFASPGKALINFDLSMFRKFAQKHGVNLSKYRRSHSTVFAAPNTKRYGTRQAAQHARLEQAKTIHHDAAIEGTFWGMFQIGGFNWKKCGADSLDDFERRMNLSEREQLELFARFCENSGLTPYLKKKDWAGFALRYNGPGYKKRNYHGRMAAAYKKYKKQK